MPIVNAAGKPEIKISEKIGLALLVLINIPTPPKTVCCIFFFCDSVIQYLEMTAADDAIKINAKYTGWRVTKITTQ